jgi:hypothetical protein
MANLLKKFKTIIFGKQESKQIASNLTEFNKTLSSYIDVLDEQVKQKKKKITSIRLLVQGMLPKEKLQTNSRINIQLVDIGKTVMKEKGRSSFNKKMDWEKKLRDVNRRNRGKIV